MNRSIQGLMIDKIVALWIVLALHNRTEKEVRKYGNRKMRIPQNTKAAQQVPKLFLYVNTLSFSITIHLVKFTSILHIGYLFNP